MESYSYSDQDPASLPSKELWGRAVCDAEGYLVGTLDSIVRGGDGLVKAVVRTGGWPARSVFVELRGAVLDREAIVVASVVPTVRAADALLRWYRNFSWPFKLKGRGAEAGDVKS